MKVLLLITSEHTGGAAIASNRLMKALNHSGINAKMLVMIKNTDEKNVISILTTFPRKLFARFYFLWERLIIFCKNRFSRENLFTVSLANTGFDVSKHPALRDADIINMHWINQGFLSLNHLQKIIRTGKPIVWTIHDMWPVTGICHHSRECDHFISECGHCFFLNSNKSNDLSHQLFLTKRKKIFSNNNITFVGCSQWLANKVKISGLSKNHPVVSIPNPIDVHFFKASDKLLSRRKMGLPTDKKLILFGAANVTDKRKGIHYLADALTVLTKKDGNNELCLIVFGQVKTDFTALIKIPVITMGYLDCPEKIASIYNAVDVFVTPSLEENLPNTIMEAMACGTPCVGFDIGGIPEMIDHKQNGYVAEYKNAEDLANGIQWVLYEADYTRLSEDARKKVESNYSEDVVAGQYLELFNHLLT